MRTIVCILIVGIVLCIALADVASADQQYTLTDYVKIARQSGVSGLAIGPGIIPPVVVPQAGILDDIRDAYRDLYQMIRVYCGPLEGGGWCRGAGGSWYWAGEN